MHIDFMARRHLAAALSITLVLASIGAVIIRGLNLGLDFTGGTLIEVHFSDPVEVGQIREQLTQRGFDWSSVQQSGNQLLVRLPPESGRDAAEIGDRLVALLADEHPGVALNRAEFIGPTVGEDLRQSAALAILLATGAIGMYIAWRFTGKFAAAALIALAHDVIITMGAFALFRWTFDLTSLAAVLTVIGYSVNDTIVVCDRVRENLRNMRRSTPIEAINRALNQTLERTLIMSGTTLAVLFALLVFGGETLRGFSAALALGVAVGTYSSIYIAAAYLVYAGLTAADLLPPPDEELRP